MYMDAQRLFQEVDESRRRAEQLVNGLPAEQLARRPDPAKWSIAECITHLTLTGGLVQHFMKKGIARAREQEVVGQGPFRLGPRGSLLIWIAEPPPKFRMPAPRRVVPPLEIPDPNQLLPDYYRVQDGWEQLVKGAEGLDLARIKIGSFFSPFRCRLSGGLMWMMAHQRRHLWQAENVKQQILAASSVIAAGA